MDLKEYEPARTRSPCHRKAEMQCERHRRLSSPRTGTALGLLGLVALPRALLAPVSSQACLGLWPGAPSAGGAREQCRCGTSWHGQPGNCWGRPRGTCPHPRRPARPGSKGAPRGRPADPRPCSCRSGSPCGTPRRTGHSSGSRLPGHPGRCPPSTSRSSRPHRGSGWSRGPRTTGRWTGPGRRSSRSGPCRSSRTGCPRRSRRSSCNCTPGPCLHSKCQTAACSQGRSKW